MFSCTRKTDTSVEMRRVLSEPADAHGSNGPVTRAKALLRTRSDEGANKTLVETMARSEGPETLRANATRLLGQILLEDASAHGSVDLKAFAQRMAQRSRDLLELAHDPSHRVGAAAVIELNTRGEVAELRQSVLLVAPELERESQEDPDAARALLALEGGPRATTWLKQIVAHQASPLEMPELVTAVAAEPGPDTFELLSTLLLRSPAMKSDYAPTRVSYGAMGTTWDAETSKAAQLFNALAKIDPDRARPLLTHSNEAVRSTLLGSSGSPR